MRKVLLPALVSLLLLTSCARILRVIEPAQTQVPCPTAALQTCAELVPASPAIYGIWVFEKEDPPGVIRNILSISENAVYLVELAGEAAAPYIRETFFEVQSVDWVNGVLTLHMKWVRLNGVYGGFDYPLKYLKVWIDGDQLFYGMGDEGQGIPAETTVGPFVKQ